VSMRWLFISFALTCRRGHRRGRVSANKNKKQGNTPSKVGERPAPYLYVNLTNTLHD
jgi:hypothetical protein